MLIFHRSNPKVSISARDKRTNSVTRKGATRTFRRHTASVPLESLLPCERCTINFNPLITIMMKTCATYFARSPTCELSLSLFELVLDRAPFSYDQCGCFNPTIWTVRSVILPGTNLLINGSFCRLDNTCYGSASAEFDVNQDIWSRYCPDCSRSCEQTDFITRLSSFSTPVEHQLDVIKQFVESSNITLPSNWSSTWRTDIPASYLRVSVSAESINTETYQQQAKMSAVDLISNIGGQTGLWIGISFLSLLEVAEMLFRLVRYQVHRSRKAAIKRLRQRRKRSELPR